MISRVSIGRNVCHDYDSGPAIYKENVAEADASFN